MVMVSPEGGNLQSTNRHDALANLRWFVLVVGLLASETKAGLEIKFNDLMLIPNSDYQHFHANRQVATTACIFANMRAHPSVQA